MKKRLIALAPCAAAFAASFYALPLLAKDTGTAMLVMLCVMPMITFICSMLYGVKRGFELLLPVIAIVLFAPTVFLYYNESAWVYAAIYGVISLAGNSAGRIFYQRR